MKRNNVYLRIILGLAFAILVSFVFVWIISAIAGSNPLLSLAVSIPLIFLFYWIDKKFNILGRFNRPEYEKRRKIAIYFKALIQTKTFEDLKRLHHLNNSDIKTLQSRVEEFLVHRDSKSVDLFLNNHLDNKGHIKTKGGNDFVFVWVIRTLRNILGS